MKKGLKIAGIIIGSLILLRIIINKITNRPTKTVFVYEKQENYKQVIDNSIAPEQVVQPAIKALEMRNSDYDFDNLLGDGNYAAERGNYNSNTPPSNSINEVTDGTKIIKGLLTAEVNKDISSVLSYFSNNVERYWDYNNPSERKLEEIYLKAWSIIDNASYRNVNIRQVSRNTYELFALYTYYSYKQRKTKTHNVHTRYILNDYGKIISSYGI